MHDICSHTRKERCEDQNVSIPTNEDVFVDIPNGLIVFVVYFR